MQLVTQPFPVSHQRSGSSCESLHAYPHPPKVASFTALRRASLHSSNTSLNQQPDPILACDTAQSFAAEDIEGMQKFEKNKTQQFLMVVHIIFP